MSEETHLFTVRIWRELLDGERREIRGRAEHVPSGERRHFRSWEELCAFLDSRSENPSKERLS